MGEQLKQRDSFDFQNLDTGLYVLKAKEVDIVDAKEEGQEERKIKNDYNYTVQFVVEGGENDGSIHFERFPHISQNHIGISKLMMCSWKMEVIPAPPHDSEKFDRERFKEKFMMQFPGRKIVGIIKKVVSKKTGGEFSNIVSFYHINELKQAQEEYNKKYVKGVQGQTHDVKKAIDPLPGNAGGSVAAATQSKPAPGKEDW